ncbi:MAG: phosphotransferase [Planctomycetes bacterium]|nr:phosphotransferase [Planctomycetota bacterium]
MKTDNANLRYVLTQFGLETCRPADIEFLGTAGGFSGAAFWRLATPNGPICLRRWPPEHPTRERLAWIHGVLRHVEKTGFALTPVPISAHSGDSFVDHDRHFWEMTPWLSGSADYDRAPSRQRLEAAMATLAEFHVAAASVPGCLPRNDKSPGIASRLDQLRSLKNEGCDQIEKKLSQAHSDWQQLVERSHRVLACFRSLVDSVEHDLARQQNLVSPLQVCIRDIWHDHVLFTGDSVSGIVDFGAMRVESVAGDVARLVGSLVADDEKGWQIGIDAYQEVRPLVLTQQQLIRTFDRSSVLMSGMNWLTWIFLEDRQFRDRETIIARLDRILMRLQGVCR